MNKEENKAIRAEFQNILDKLIDSKIRPTGTAIIAVEQPMVLLFERVMYKLERQQEEIEELKQSNKNNIQVAYGGRRFGTEGMVVKDYISKDKIKEKLNQIHNEFSNILLDKKLSLEEQNLNAHRYDAIRNVLEELLEEK